MKTGRKGQAMQWVLGGIGTVSALVFGTWGLATNSLRGTVENIQDRQDDQAEA